MSQIFLLEKRRPHRGEQRRCGNFIRGKGTSPLPSKSEKEEEEEEEVAFEFPRTLFFPGKEV